VKIYVDTNVYLDYLLNRKNKQGKDLSKQAFEVFRRAAGCEFYILVSNHLVHELCGVIDLGDVTTLMEFLKIKIIKIEDEAEGKGDEFHAFLAEKHGADLIVTRNKNDFKNFALQAYLPEDL